MHLTIKNGAIEIKGQTILENVNFEITDGKHIGVVGRNGSGKTTLLKAIIDNELFSEGIDDSEFQIIKIGNYKIGYIEQIRINDNLTLFEELINSFEELVQIEKKIADLSTKLTSDKNILSYSNALDRYKQLGGYTYKKTVEVMINKFGFSAEDKNKLLSEFSGGERMKISFMKLLLSNPDLLILDEPTNHLDVTTIEWLEGYLKNYKKAFIVVSHDRMFLDNIVDIIYDIEYGQTIKYVGNYTKYVELKEQRYNKLLKDYEYQQSEIKRLRQLYERFRSKPTKAKMALSKLKQIERMTIIDKPQKANTKSFSANTKGIASPSKIVLNVRDLEFGYDKPLGKISLEVESGKKIAIIGSNGTGKSTLLKTLCGIIKPYSGKVSYGFNVKYDYFDQNLEFSTKGTILEEFRYKYPDLLNEEARKALGSFLFTGEDVQKELKVLSGGEKVRLLLCEVFFSKSNLLFLDEPTNHLDIIGKEKLEKTLKEYPQTVIFVSHDRYFVNKVADELIVLEDNQVKYYRYGYADYLQDRSKKKEQESLKTTNKVKNVKTSIPDKNNKHVIKKLEKEIELIDKKIKELSQELYKEDNFNDYEKMNSINKEIEELKNKLSLKEQEWEKLVTD